MQMDEDTIADLKQFITGVVVQQIASVRDDISRLEKKVDDLSVYVADVIHDSNEANASHLKNHERRIVRLEKKAA